jgi:signal transduction histidine kinase
MAVVAAVSALLLALAASLTAWLLWQSEEQKALGRAADAMVEAIDREAREENTDLVRSAAEAFRESALPGYRAEVWSGSHLAASNAVAPPIGPGGPRADSERWLRDVRPLAGSGLVLVMAAPPGHGQRALRVFAFSLAVATPVCLAVAFLVGRAVAGRATRPLLDLQARIRALRGMEPWPPAGVAGAPDEVCDLEDAFRDLWGRLEDMVRREREFAANASHELRLPLTRLRLQAERAIPDAGPVARQALAAQMGEVDRLVRLIDSLLVLARDASAGIPGGETVNVADVCRRVAARVLDGARAAECGFPDEALVRGDEELIEIAVQNVVDNARKFSVAEGPVRAVLIEGEGRVRLEVTTPGARVGAAERERLFDRFYRSPEARVRKDGHGLGLALARHVARLHGGDLRCVSAEADDARFALDLPAWTGHPAPSA